MMNPTNPNPNGEKAKLGLRALMGATSKEEVQKLQEQGLNQLLPGINQGLSKPPAVSSSFNKEQTPMGYPREDPNDTRDLERALNAQKQRVLLESQERIHQTPVIPNLQPLIEQALAAYVNGPEFRKRVRTEAIAVITEALKARKAS
jgi:hypothetical protein